MKSKQQILDAYRDASADNREFAFHKLTLELLADIRDSLIGGEQVDVKIELNQADWTSEQLHGLSKRLLALAVKKDIGV